MNNINSDRGVLAWGGAGDAGRARAVYHRLADGRWETRERSAAQEATLTVYVNGRETVTLLCTPEKLQFLILGHLYFQGIIQGVRDVVGINVCPDEPVAQVQLVSKEVALPQPRVISSGCGSAAAAHFRSDSLPPLTSDLRLTSDELITLMAGLSESARLFRTHGGVHTSGLATLSELLIAVEDIGRHNTVDKIQGECLYRELPTRDKILLTTGRLSSEMVEKAALMGVPVVASRNSPTERAVRMADRLGMTLVGYLRGPHMTVYTHPARIQDLGLIEGDMDAS